jgi:propionyl-CoA carboxylase alpha chain
VTFTSLLVANRGEIARRVMRTARQMGIRCIAVYTASDADALFVGDADEAVRIETGYMDEAAILDAARVSGAEAIHPGYGFLSENAHFATAVGEAGLVWVGPGAAAVAAMGDKLAAKRLAVEVGVPTLPSSDDPSNASAVGYPLLVKAAAGGGGKGMRVVGDPSGLDAAVAAARREAASGFGERECSIQRRHQKLIEESPSPVVDATMRAAMGEAALRLAGAIGYQSAGTVEFLVDDATREFFFLEVNTRLQVEHPVTEAVTGLDLVREQLRVAAGEPLGYGQDDIRFSGHAIEARLCAEDPAAGFLPATGTLAAFEVPEAPVVRWDSGVGPGSRVTVEFDPLLAKVIAHAPTRADAASALAGALERLHVGGVRTNRDFLAATLRHRAFLAGDTTTDFIERCRPRRTLELSAEELEWSAAAAALWLQAQDRASAPVLAQVSSGWRNARLPDQRTLLRHGDDELAVTYAARRDGSFEVGGRTARVHAHSASWIDVEIAGRRRRTPVTQAGERIFLQCGRGTVEFDVVPRFEVPGTEEHMGSLAAPMPGTVMAVLVAVGDRVSAGTTLVILEAMKMEHHISAPADGTVSDVHVTAGQQVENGAALLVLESEEPEEESA